MLEPPLTGIALAPISYVVSAIICSRHAYLMRVGPRPAKHVRHPSLAIVVRITCLNVGLRRVPLVSVQDSACMRVLKTSKGNVTCAHQSTRGETSQLGCELTSHAVTPAMPPAAMSSAHVSPELSSASASSISESWCRCRLDGGGGGGGGLSDLKNRHAASYLTTALSWRRPKDWGKCRGLTCKSMAHKLDHGSQSPKSHGRDLSSRRYGGCAGRHRRPKGSSAAAQIAAESVQVRHATPGG